MNKATTTGDVLDRRVIDDLRSRIEGNIVQPDDEEFAEATMIWNAGAASKPSLVVRALSRADVVETVKFVVANDIPMSIKGGGHNIAGLALVENGLTLDMSLMRSVVVDGDAMTAIVEPGCTLGDVDRETQKHGLATTLGFVSETGVAGLALGGGFGYLTRQFGWTVDDLLEVEIVIADGSVLRASR
jgi:FAD/FMN-containing dehydrogenase